MLLVTFRLLVTFGYYYKLPLGYYFFYYLLIFINYLYFISNIFVSLSSHKANKLNF